MNEKIDVFCIGTPKIIGDSIGPLVGSMLLRHNLDVNIVGSVEDPVTRSNYHTQVARLREGATIIAVDAVIGGPVGTYTIMYESMKPGEAMEAGIESIGDISVKCYTGTTVVDMIKADQWSVSLLAYDITTELIDMVNKVQNKVYI